MTKYTQKSLLALALAATFAAPLAMAQSTTPATATHPTAPAATTTPSTAPSMPSLDQPSASVPNTTADTTRNQPLSSQSKASTGQKTWEELDTNKDGNLSKAEADADPGMKAIFAKADANGDGILTPEEYRAYYDKYVAKTSH